MSISSRTPELPDDVSVVPSADVLSALGVDPDQGLTRQEAAQRLEQYGPNELEGTPRDPAWLRFLRQFKDPLVYLLLAAIGISLAAWAAEGAHGVPIDAVVIVIIVVANAIIGFVQENQAEDAVAALSEMTATHVTVVRDGRLTDIPATELVPGDIMALSEGDAVGADARLVSSNSLQVLEASLTGESTPAEKDPSTLEEAAPLGDRLDMVFRGTDVARGVGRAVVVSTGMSTEMGRIATMLGETKATATPLEKEIRQITTMLGGLVIAIAVAVMIVLAVVNGVNSFEDAVEILLMGVALAVAAVPEGLPAILSLVLAMGVRVLARRNAVMKNLPSVETLGSVSVIASDKTGTLTRNEMTLREIVTASGRVELGGTGYAPVGEAHAEGQEDVALEEARRLVVAGVRANNAQLMENEGEWETQGDPTEVAFLVAQHKLGEDVPQRADQFERADEVPFTSERKMMSVLDHSPDERLVFAKGAPDVLLGHCVSEEVGGQEQRPLTEERREQILGEVERLSREGYRTLATAWRAADDEQIDESSEEDLVFLGVVAIIDPPREEAAQAISEAHRAGIRTMMITGDHPVTAARIAADLGIVQEGEKTSALTGRELDALSPEQRKSAVEETSVYARVAPENKLEIVHALQENGHIVAMTGDGVNDAPALKAADIGIAMGITGTEVTKQAGTMILGDDNYATIVTAVRQGRVIFDNIKKFMRFLLSSNMGEVATIFLGVLLGSVIGLADPANPGAAVLPLLATQILWVNLVTDSGPALAMGVDPEIDDVMARKPRATTDRVIDRHMWQRILSIGLVIGVINMVLYDLMLPGGLIGSLEHLAPTELQWATAQTTVFTALVFMQLFNALNSRSDMASAFSHLFTNRWLWLSLGFVALSQVLVVHVPFLQRAFSTVRLDAAHWGLAIGAGLLVLVYEEVVKAVRRAMAG